MGQLILDAFSLSRDVKHSSEHGGYNVTISLLQNHKFTSRPINTHLSRYGENRQCRINMFNVINDHLCYIVHIKSRSLLRANVVVHYVCNHSFQRRLTC